MKNVSIENSPVAQKLAASSLTRAIRSKFKLYPHEQARGIIEMCKNEGVDPEEAMKFLEENLPGLITDFLAETRKIVSHERGQKGLGYFGVKPVTGPLSKS